MKLSVTHYRCACPESDSSTQLEQELFGAWHLSPWRVLLNTHRINLVLLNRREEEEDRKDKWKWDKKLSHSTRWREHTNPVDVNSHPSIHSYHTIHSSTPIHRSIRQHGNTKHADKRNHSNHKTQHPIHWKRKQLRSTMERKKFDHSLKPTVRIRIQTTSIHVVVVMHSNIRTSYSNRSPQ